MVDMFEDGWHAASSALERLRLARRTGIDLLGSVFASRLASRNVPAPPGDDWTRGAAGPSAPRLLEGLAGDLRLAQRSLLKRPGFTGVVVATLALGVGVNSAIFTFVNGLLLRPLPYAEPAQLVQLSETFPDIGTMDVSFPDFHRWRAETQVFEGMFAFDDGSFLISGADVPRLVEGAVVSPGFLSVLGVAPSLGRGFLPDEEMPGSDGVAIISEALWRDDFGATPDVLDRSVVLNGRPRRIVGVAGAGFHFPEVAQVWVPLALDPGVADPEDYGYDVVARLRPDRTVHDARAEGARVAAALAREHPGAKTGIGADAYSLRVADVPRALAVAALLLQGAVSLVLLIACLNVANLLLARGEDRAAEMALRRALGASRSRLVRQVLAESALLAAAGALGALALAHWASPIFLMLLPDEVPFWLSFDMDWRVASWTAATASLACLAVGLPPALRASGDSGAGEAAIRVTGGRSFDRGRQGLIVVQVALATMLLVGAGLMIRGLANLEATDPGMDPSQVLVLSAVYPPWSHPEGPERTRAQMAVVERVASLDGVESAAAVASVPLLGGPDEVAVESAGPSQTRVGTVNGVSEAYFSTMRIPVVAGRGPTHEEVWSGAHVAVVSESLARELWPDGDVLGRRLRHGVPGNRSPTVSDDQPWLDVVGVVGDVRQESLGRPPRGAVYVPFGSWGSGHLTLVVRTDLPPLDHAGVIQGQISEIDPLLAFLEPTSMREAMAFATWSERLASGLLSAFAALALGLSLVGIYGVVSFVTGRRTNEIGVRLAIGATPGSVVTLVVRDSGKLVAAGVGIGLVGGALASKAFSSMLYGVRPFDPVTLMATALLLGAVGLAASYGPARRAARTDAVRALRAE
jgi:predicted permease